LSEDNIHRSNRILTLLYCICIESSRKSKKSSKEKRDKNGSSDDDHNKHLRGPRRTLSNSSVDKSVESESERKEKGRRSSLRKSSIRSRDTGGSKEDTKPSVPRRGSLRESDDSVVEKSPSYRKHRRNTRHKEESGDDGTAEDGDDKQPTKSGRRTTRRVSPENSDDNELNVGSFHSLRKDSDKPRRSRSKDSSKRRTPSNGRRHKTPTSTRSNRRRLKDSKGLNNSDHYTEVSDDGEHREVNLKDEEVSTSEKARKRRERRRDRERQTESNGSKGGIRRVQSERWNNAVENMEAEGVENPNAIRRRAHESLNRASDGLSRSAHTKIRRNNSRDLSKMSGSLGNRSYHGPESSDRRTSSDGKRTPRRKARRQRIEEWGSAGDDSTGDSFNDGHSFGDGRSQATLESIEDFEDYGDDVYGREMMTPGMIDFEEEMLDLMQRANPEVTDHLDRRVHRKREMVAFDHNMPMMTRQALLTRQQSSQLQRRFFDGGNIDKKRLLLRNDSMGNSSHRPVRSALGRRAPPRAKSSGLGAMGRESDDRRGGFRSRSGQVASFNQYYQTKPNKVRNLSRRASGDLVQPPVRGQARSSDPRRRPVQRAKSSTAIPRKPVRRYSSDFASGDDDDKKDMSIKRNRAKLHSLMYTMKMGVDMDDLFKKVREGDTPRPPIDTLRMPSP